MTMPGMKPLAGVGILKCAIAVSVIAGCTAGPRVPVSLPAPRTVGAWVTTGDQSRLLSREADLQFSARPVDSGIPVIDVDETRTFQSVFGWGAAMSDASAYLIQTKLSADQREALLEDLFGRDSGLGFSFVRIPMGASDFSRSHYSYDDRPAGQTDSALAHFSIDVDRAEKIPALKRALAINPEIRPGMVSLPKGLWRKSTYNGATSNALVPDTLTDLGGGACFNDARVQVASLGKH